MDNRRAIAEAVMRKVRPHIAALIDAHSTIVDDKVAIGENEIDDLVEALGRFFDGLDEEVVREIRRDMMRRGN